jgi:DNA-binding NtrC family response regulator
MIPCPQSGVSRMVSQKMPITLVEPDEAVRSALTTLLEDRGWEVNALDSGVHLEEILTTAQPMAVVCEASLPDQSAASVLDTCRAHHVPVVFLGHQTEVQSAVDLVRMGAEDFLEKPFPQARLLNLLDSLAAAETP